MAGTLCRFDVSCYIRRAVVFGCKRCTSDEGIRLLGADNEECNANEDLDAQPEIIPTMSVAPPRGAGRVRLMKIGDIDLQPCGGTHVSRTGEIQHIRVTKIESKGKRNRRVSIAFVD